MSEKIYGIDMGTNSIKIYQKAAGVILHQKKLVNLINCQMIIKKYMYTNIVTQV